LEKKDQKKKTKGKNTYAHLVRFNKANLHKNEEESYGANEEEKKNEESKDGNVEKTSKK
jgi:hypothetical protein